MEAKFQRARRPQQKEERREAILYAARELLDRGDRETLTLNGLARAVGLTKSSLYRYFESHEAVLTTVLCADIGEWVDEVQSVLAGPVRETSPQARIERIAAAIADTAVARPRMCRLISMLASVLEENLSADNVRRFKRDLMAEGGRMARAMHEAMPALSVTQHIEALRYTIALIAGLWPTAQPPPVVAEVLAEAEFAVLNCGFRHNLTQSVALILRGLAA